MNLSLRVLTWTATDPTEAAELADAAEPADAADATEALDMIMHKTDHRSPRPYGRESCTSL